jgi:hypothetical protein
MAETMAETERIMKKTMEQTEETDVAMENITDSYQNCHNTHQTDGETILYMLYENLKREQKLGQKQKLVH